MEKIADKKNIFLVTGTAGFIGMHLAKKLLEDGCEVVGVDSVNDYYDPALKKDRLKILKKFEKFIFYKCLLEDKKKLMVIFKKHKPHVVVNLAAQAGVRYSIENPDVYIQSNVVGFFNILELCRANPVKCILYASSSSVYGANTKVPFSTEDRVDTPISLYAATKRTNELMAYTYSHLYSIPTTGLRFFTVYGPYGRPDMALFLFVKAILEGNKIKVFNNGNMLRDFTYVDDIISGIIALINKKLDSGGKNYALYNIGNNAPVKLMDFISVIEKLLSKKAVIEYLPMQPGDVPATYADIDALVKDSGFKPSTPIETGVKKFIDWYKSYYKIG